MLKSIMCVHRKCRISYSEVGQWIWHWYEMANRSGTLMDYTLRYSLWFRTPWTWGHTHANNIHKPRWSGKWASNTRTLQRAQFIHIDFIYCVIINVYMMAITARIVSNSLITNHCRFSSINERIRTITNACGQVNSLHPIHANHPAVGAHIKRISISIKHTIRILCSL